MGISKEYVAILVLFRCFSEKKKTQQNILVDNTGHARIADFGLARITKNPHSALTASHHHGHTPRWSAPEVLKEWTYNKEADVFSFAMVMYEVRRSA